MTKERFIEILVEEGIGRAKALDIWGCRPVPACSLTEEDVRETAVICIKKGVYIDHRRGI